MVVQFNDKAVRCFDGGHFDMVRLDVISFSRFGVEPRLCDLTDIGAVEKVVDGNTCCIYMEIITNPQMEVVDLQALSRIVHERGIPLIVDTTLIRFT